MRLSQPLKILTGLLTALYFILPVFIFFTFFIRFTLIPIAQHTHSLRDAEAIMALFPLLMFPLIICINVLHFGLQILYIVLVNKDRQLSETPRILFTLGLVFIPFIAMPLYYFMYLLKAAPPNPSPQPDPDEF
jgi:hypothetical protein